MAPCAWSITSTRSTREASTPSRRCVRRKRDPSRRSSTGTTGSATSYFGGAKGFGMAFVVDVFSSLLMGAAFGPHVSVMYGGDDAEHRKLGQFFCAINPANFTDRERFCEQMDQLIDELHAVEPAEGFERVLVPGEPETRHQQLRLESGIPLTAEVHRYLFG
nr:Ldh family oxidoreductase [Cohnella nanjingensis]